MGTPVTISTLFSDLVDSTAIATRLGPVAAESHRQRHFDLLRSAIADHGGTEVKSTGDGVMVVFASTTAAVACAVAMQRAAAAHNRGDGEMIVLRIGVSHGEADEESHDYYGPPVVEAARLCAAAGHAEILVSSLVHLLAAPRSDHRFESAGTLELKGLPPTEAHRVDWRSHGVGTRVLPEAMGRSTMSAFVGRAAELEQLAAAHAAAAGGSGRLMMIGGEPGIGKSRLAAEAARAGLDGGAVVLFGRCSEDPLLPFQPFAEALADHARSCPEAELPDPSVASTGLLVRVVPRLADRYDASPPAFSSDASTERFVLFEAFGDWLDSVATGAGPVTLVLDDLHWADASTLQLLAFLARRVESRSLLMLGTYRETEISRVHPLGSLLADLRRERLVDRISLHGLDDVGVSALVEGLTGSRPPGDFTTRLRAETEGNPFFVEEVLVHLRESGAVELEPDGWRVVTDLEDLGIPEGVRDVIGRRLSRLGQAADALLTVASVCGREFDLGVVADAAECTTSEVLDVLDAAVAAGLVESIPGSTGRIRFTHALVHQTLYEECSGPRRLVLHRRVAAALERSETRDDHVGPIAHHLLEAAPLVGVGPAITAGERAADQANERYAFEEAVEWLERGLAVLESLAPSEHRLRAELLLRISVHTHRRNDLARAAEAGRGAIDQARAAGDLDQLAVAALRVLYAAYVPGKTNWELVEVCNEVLAGLGDEERPATRAVALAVLSWELGPSDEPGSQAAALAAYELAADSGDPAAIGPALYVQALALARTGRAREAMSIARRSVLADLALDDFEFIVPHRLNECAIVLQAGEVATYRRYVDEFVEWAEASRSIWARGNAEGLRSGMLLMEGRLAEAEAALATTIERLGLDSSEGLLVYGIQGLGLALERDDLAQQKAILEAAIAAFPDIGAWKGALIGPLFRSGQVRDARAIYDALWAGGLDRWWVGAGVTGLVAGTEAAALFDDPQHAATLDAAFAPFDGELVVLPSALDCRGAVSLYRGMLARIEGDHDRAIAAITDAQVVHDRLGSARWTARGAVELATTLLDRDAPGDATNAAAILGDALELTRRHHLVGTEHRIDALRAR